MTSAANSPFNWRQRTEPSIFAKDPHFRTRADGKTASQQASDTLDARRKNGDDPGTMYGIGKPSKEKEAKMLAYRQFGIYSKAVPATKQPNKHEK